MNRAGWLRSILGTVLILALGLVVVAIGTSVLERRAPQIPESSAQRGSSFEVRGLDLEFFDGRRYDVRIHADRLQHRSRRFGPLTINPVKEVEIQGVRLVLDASKHDVNGAKVQSDLLVEEAVATIRDSFMNLLAQQKLGFVTRVIVDGIDIDLRQRAETVTHLHAGHMVVAAPGSLTFAERLDLQSPAGDRLQAVEARWDAKLRRLVVIGPYLLNGGGGRRTGNGGSVSIGERGEILVD